MRKSIIKFIIATIAFLAIGHSISYAGGVYKFRCFEDKQVMKGGAKGTGMDWVKVDMLVVINTEKGQIRIFGATPMDFDIVDYNKTTESDNGDTHLHYGVVDANGVRCNAEVVLYKDQSNEHIGTLIFEYANLSYFFRLKTN